MSKPLSSLDTNWWNKTLSFPLIFFSSFELGQNCLFYAMPHPSYALQVPSKSSVMIYQKYS